MSATPGITLWDLVDLYADALKNDAAVQAAFTERYGAAPRILRGVRPRTRIQATEIQPYLIVLPVEAEIGDAQGNWPYKLLVAAAVRDEETSGEEQDLTCEGARFLTGTLPPLLLASLSAADANIWPGSVKLFLDMETPPLLVGGFEIIVTVPHTLGASVVLGA